MTTKYSEVNKLKYHKLLNTAAEASPMYHNNTLLVVVESHMSTRPGLYSFCGSDIMVETRVLASSLLQMSKFHHNVNAAMPYLRAKTCMATLAVVQTVVVRAVSINYSCKEAGGQAEELHHVHLLQQRSRAQEA